MPMAQSNQITTIDYAPEYYISLTDGGQPRTLSSLLLIDPAFLP
jgi:hypothetical protein